MKARYEIVKESIISGIESGEYPVGSKLPRSQVFCKMLDVSEITVRRAFTDLVESGYVHRVNGKGTFVGTGPESEKKSEPRQIMFVGHREWGGFWTNMMLGAQKAAEEKGYKFLFYVDEDMQKDEKSFIRQIDSPDMAGVIFNVDEFSDSLYAAIREVKAKVMIADFMHSEFDYVDCDCAKGINSAVEHLHCCGHRKIAFLTSRDRAPWTEIRLDAYFSALDKLEVPVADRFVYYTRCGEEGLKELREMLADHHTLPFTAIQCSTDIQAMNFIRVCLEKGISVPEDIAVSGFGNIPELELFPVPFTTVDQDSFEEGRLACSFLIDKIEGKITERTKYHKECKLVVR